MSAGRSCGCRLPFGTKPSIGFALKQGFHNFWNLRSTPPLCRGGAVCRAGHPFCGAVGGWFPAFLLLLLLAALAPFPAAASLEERYDLDEETPWHVTADAIAFDDINEQYVATGDVLIESGSVSLKADYVRLDHQVMKAYAEGNVELAAANGDTLRGSRMEMDLVEQIGFVENGAIFLKENNFHITGKRIEKTGEDTYTADEATVTSCDGDNPDWQIKGKKVNVTMGGYGYVHHASLWTRKLPIFYSPLVVFPAKRKRQTGFLTPEIGSSDRLGLTYIQPFFWAISDNQDATFYAQYMEERGIKLGAEYRYILSEKTKGAVMADGFRDREVDDGVGDHTDKWGYDDDTALRENEGRYWFRMKHDQELPFGFNGKLDLDVVSDQDYLDDFEDSYMGFEQTNKFFTDEFGRGLDEVDDPVRTNRLNISRYWTRFSLNVEARWYDDVIRRQTDAYETTQQRLPYVGFAAVKQQVMDTPFFFDLESSYNYFYSEDGTRGHRTDIHPRLYYPIVVGQYFTFEPSVGYHATNWWVTEFEDIPSENWKDESEFRGIYDLKLDLSSELYSIYDFGGSELSAVKHTVRPQLVYDYIPYQNQTRYAAALLNEVPATNRITASLTNILTAKHRSESVLADDAGSDGSAAEFLYDQIGWLKLEQSYDFNEASENDPRRYRNGIDRQPFSPLSAELLLNPWRYVSINADASWNFYDSGFETRNIGMSLSDKRGDRLFVEHRYENDLGSLYRSSSESIYADVLIKIIERLSVFADYERNIHESQHIRTTVGFLFTEQCWSFDFRVVDEPDDLKVKFLVNLYGLGGIGN
jgi:LPS-assembly protein